MTDTDDKPKRGWSPARRAAQDARRRNGPDPTRTDAEQIAEDVVGEAVDNVKTIATLFLMPLAPYTGVTLAGVIDPDSPPDNPQYIVRSRAEMAGSVLLEHAKRNRRVLAAVQRFNLMCKNVEAVEVVGAVIASVAVDVKLVPADATIQLPGGAQFPILSPAIGDTIEFIASQQPPPPPEPQRAEAAPRSEAKAAQPDNPYGDGATLRESLNRRNAAIAAGEPDPGPVHIASTVRREGQAIVTGGVKGT